MTRGLIEEAIGGQLRYEFRNKDTVLLINDTIILI